MLRSTLAASLLAASALAQENLKSRLHPITAEVRHAGVFHVATGTWTRGAALAGVIGPDTIYNNTCWTGYHAGMIGQCEEWQHRSRIPSPTGPLTPTTVPNRTGFDEAPGCRTSYLVSGFQIGYCSRRAGPVSWQFDFADSYTACGAADLVPTQTFDLPGLPGGTATGGQQCWTIDVDLTGSGQTFTAQADGDGSYTGPSTVEQFGWSWAITSPAFPSDSTGPIIAGNYTWTGGPVVGPLSPCKGTDGTIWDTPVNLAEEGTGMASNDYFRVTLQPPPLSCIPEGYGGCYYFGGTVHADFHLELYADAACPPSPMSSFCHPGEGGVIACPCDNAPSSSGRGCDNSSATGGAVLNAYGSASLAADMVVFHTEDERPVPLSILAQGTAPIAAGMVYGQGVRCVGGTIKRLYLKTASGGSITAPQGGDPSVSARSAALGDPIPPGAARHYFVYYRDPVVLGECPRASTFNATQGGSIIWTP